MADNKLTNTKKITTILDALGQPPYKYKVAEISEVTGINRSTVYRILYELMEDGYVMQEEISGKFCIGASLYNTGMVYLHNFHYESSIQAVLEEAARMTRESVGLAYRDGDRVISLYETEIHQYYKMRYRPGIFYPMNRGCYGKTLMAYYDEDKISKLLDSQKFEKVCKNTLTTKEEILNEFRKIREQGYSICDEETEPLLEAVGAPIFDSKGQVNYCVAVAFLKDENYLDTTNRFIEIMKESALKLSKLIP